MPKAVRYRDGVNRSEELAVSRTVVDHVLKEGQGVLVSDAQADARFRGGGEPAQAQYPRGDLRADEGPARNGRRAVPRHAIDLEADSSAGARRRGKFTEDHLTLASAIAHQAAIAVEESRYHQALVNAERLAAVGQTIAAMSHHIKNIMQGVRFGADMVRTAFKDEDSDLLGKGWKLVERNQGRIDQLILDMLSFSKDREPVDRADRPEQALQGRAGTGPRPGSGERESRSTGDPARTWSAVPCDPDGIHRAVLNIVSNALDAVEDRPNPKVGLQALLEPDGNWAKIIVIDNGPGIAASDLEDIFRPFVSTKGSRGTGLGLPVSRKILREHGGDIIVQSIPEKGSKFALRIPLNADSASEQSGTHLSPPLRTLPE